MENAIQKAIEGGYGDFLSLKNINQFYVVFNRKETTTIEKNDVEEIVPITQSFAIEHILLDPLFWEALGKSLGWSNIKYTIPKFQRSAIPEDNRIGYKHETRDISEWQFHWHRFIDHLAEGKDAESFFNELLQ